jgi:hypothetical protein
MEGDNLMTYKALTWRARPPDVLREACTRVVVMQRKRSDQAVRARRWEDFRRRAEYAPQNVYRHRMRGWEYIPVHPFGDEPEVLERLSLRPSDCRGADAWWGIDGDATLMESRVGDSAELFAKPTPYWERWVYLVAVFDAPFVTREAFEEAMCRFADAGFPRDPRFQLAEGDPWLRVRSS